MSSVYRICNATAQGPVECFISYFVQNKGKGAWYTLPHNFSTFSQSDWYRSGGWETVVFKDQAGKRRGFYLYCPVGVALEIKFYGIERDLGLRYVNPDSGIEVDVPTVEEVAEA